MLDAIPCNHEIQADNLNNFGIPPKSDSNQAQLLVNGYEGYRLSGLQRLVATPQK